MKHIHIQLWHFYYFNLMFWAKFDLVLLSTEVPLNKKYILGSRYFGSCNNMYLKNPHKSAVFLILDFDLGLWHCCPPARTIHKIRYHYSKLSSIGSVCIIASNFKIHTLFICIVVCHTMQFHILIRFPWRIYCQLSSWCSS